jgi:hypothetical protein
MGHGRLGTGSIGSLSLMVRDVTSPYIHEAHTSRLAKLTPSAEQNLAVFVTLQFWIFLPKPPGH